MKERHENMLIQLRKAPDPFTEFPEQLLFLWPKEGPSLTEALGPQLEALDLIRSNFLCHVFVLKELGNYICVVSQDHDTIKQVAHRLRTKWGEVIAKNNIRSKVYIAEPPEACSMKGEVVVERKASCHKARLDGDLLNGAELEHWRTRVALILSKNNARLVSAVEESLRGLVFVRGHLRMRVNLGLFILENYRAPRDGKPSYGFEEFREMLLYEQTKGRLIPGLKVDQNELLERCYKATHLLEPYETTSSSLENAELAYSVNFEFLGSNNSMLRLEAEFAKSPGAQDYEITQRRWLRPRKSGQSSDKQPLLQIGVIDFERSDWQLEIKSLEFHETASIDAALRSFSHSIGFRRTGTMSDICAKPQRKVVFPNSAPVSRFVEKTAIRYRLKGTKYTLEIARYDEYSRTNVPAFPGQSIASMTSEISDVPSTSWGASVFDANWDNLLGEHANLSVGHSAGYDADINTFFPSQTGLGSEDKRSGFWEFAALVKQVAALLGPASMSSQSTAGVQPSPAVSDPIKVQSASRELSPTLGVQQFTELLHTDLGHRASPTYA
ncbi:hypothetical protein EYZ11_004167 [Aspergillus tanneri]|uniref:DUF7905 domain-containing protein n=1 Tax=Aspergillus tanneri TaxID=1220188 RepID=A0A4S3JLH4_9EURO|nr:hypothetical protein EYZ11_004167 [Aspergillus tanneri]